MTEKFDLVLRGGTVATPSGFLETDVGVKNGRIHAIGDIDVALADEVFEAKGLHVLPGVIDSQVHFREPGLEHKEDLATGTASAALGGVVAIFEMPNTKPGTTTAEAFQDKINRAKGRAWTDFAFFMGAAGDNADKLGELEKMHGCSGVKIFMGSSTGTLLVEDDAAIETILAGGSRRVAVHCEDEARLRERFALVKDGADVSQHPVWRDELTALLATQRLVRLAIKTKRRVHVLHVTTAEEMDFLRDHKEWATVEVTPQHLTLAAPDCYERLGAYAQMNPPIRDERHRAALWAAINSGIVDVIGSDHAPHTREEKSKPYPQTPSGMTGVQTLVPLMLNHVKEGRLSLQRFVDLTSAGPARVFGMAGKGRIAAGYDADFTLVDLGERRKITNMWIASKSGWTPFDGMRVTGWPKATIVRGRIVMRDDQLLGDPIGEPVRFHEARG